MSGVTVVTGASSGVGAALARRVAARGGVVAAIARDAGRLAALADGARIVAVPLDVADEPAVTAAFARIERDLGPIAALVNNAAVFDRRPLVAQDAATVRRIVEVDLLGAIWCARAALPGMRARRAGRIVNVASVAGTRGIADQAVYCAAKHGLVGFAAALAQEVVRDGILVSTLCPGGIDTPLWTDAAGANPYPGDRATLMAADEVAEAIEFTLTRPKGSLYKTMTFFPASEWH